MRRIFRKLVQGLTTASAAVGAASLVFSARVGELRWVELGAVFRVGLPAAVIGMLFFPVDEKALKHRGAFALRAFGAALLASALHRVLFILDHPWVETIAFDATMLLALGATAGATALAWLAQPALLKLARPKAWYAGRIDGAQSSEAARLPPVRVHAHRG